jgi:hypothetical protein
LIGLDSRYRGAEHRRRAAQHFQSQSDRLAKIEFFGSPIVEEILSLYALYFNLMVDLFSSQRLMPSRSWQSKPSNRVDIASLYYLALCTLWTIWRY